MKIVCFDTETTGLDVQKDHIIQLSLVKLDVSEDSGWETVDTKDWYILPETDFVIPAEAEAVHHISKEFLKENGVSLRSVYDELIEFTDGCDMLSYNGNNYDAQILYYNLKRIGKDFQFEGRTWYDALILERAHMEGKLDPATGERYHCNLTAAYTRYYGHPFEGAHNSLDDVHATIEVFKAQVAEHGWEWAQREEFGFISYDRWLTRKGGFYYLVPGAHKGESIETMLRIDRSYLEWIVDKCQWTDQQTRDIILPYLGGKSKKDQASPSTERGGDTVRSSSQKLKKKGKVSTEDWPTLFD